jgi:hypothetical protein
MEKGENALIFHLYIFFLLVSRFHLYMCCQLVPCWIIRICLDVGFWREIEVFFSSKLRKLQNISKDKFNAIKMLYDRISCYSISLS